jgi:hypothetical protein
MSTYFRNYVKFCIKIKNKKAACCVSVLETYPILVSTDEGLKIIKAKA